MDALGMLFVYNLDDISGDLGFVDHDDWDGLRLAWIYHEMVLPNWQPREGNERDKTSEDMTFIGILVQAGYTITTVLLLIMVFVLPVLAMITPFRAISPDK